MCARLLSFAAALAGLALATPAHADLTASRLLDLWQSLGTGQALTPARSVNEGVTLSLVEVALALDLGQGATLTGTIPRIDLTDRGDGTVAIGLPPRHDLRLRVSGPSGETLNATLVVDTTGLRIVASGGSVSTSYAIDAPRIGLTLGETRWGDVRVDLAVSAHLAGLAGRLTRSRQPVPAWHATLTASGLTIDAQGQDASDEGRALALNATYGPLDADVRTGAPGAGTLSLGVGTFGVSVEQPGYVPFALTGTSATNRLTLAPGDAAVEQTGHIGDTALSIEGSILPLDPFQARIASADWSLRLPTGTGDPALRLDVAGATFAQALWDRLDPGGALPREGASLHVDITGKGQGPVPGNLALNALRLSVAGMDLTGLGTLNRGTGNQAPDGTLDLTLTGSDAFLAQLVDLGLVSPDRAMGAQFILGLFTTPAGDGQVRSTLTLSPDGRITANGQRVK